jgi:tetratricopeptide (TPR) repeat protein
MTFGRHLMRMNKYDVAAKQFEVALGINDKDVEAMIALGRALLELNQSDQAVARFQDALKRSPNDLQAQVGLGRAYLAQGLFDKANATIEGVITVQPSNLEAHMALGEVSLKQGNPDEAVKRFKQAVLIDPSVVGPRMQLAQIFRKQKKFTEAIGELEVLLMYQPKDSSVKRMLITLYTEGNSDLKLALRHVDELLGSGGMDLELLKLKGRILLGLQDLEQASLVVEEALVVSPDDPDLVQLRAKIQDARKNVPVKKGGGKPHTPGITIIK